MLRLEEVNYMIEGAFDGLQPLNLMDCDASFVKSSAVLNYAEANVISFEKFEVAFQPYYWLDVA
jgi:hypothetical protein